jgi:death-on-curing protein
VNELTVEQVLFLHSRIIDVAGGSHGVRDLGLLQSAVARPAVMFGGKELYPDIFHRAAALMESLIKNHPFIDGNKRTAITAAGVYLARNGYVLEAGQRELERFTLAKATKKFIATEAADWFKRHSVKRD